MKLNGFLLLAGTLKPTCMVPKTMGTYKPSKADKVVVLGFEALKDFYPNLISKNLKDTPGYSEKTYEIVMIDPELADGRDVTALDVARYLMTEKVLRLAEKMRKVIKPGSVVIIPPVLGTRPSYRIADTM